MDKNAKVAFFGAAHDGLAGLAYGAGMPVQGGARPSRFWQISYPNSTRGGGGLHIMPPTTPDFYTFRHPWGRP